MILADKKYKVYKGLNLPECDKEILDFWDKEKIFQKSISERANQPAYVFYEGPPSANGMPGIHHVMSRAIKDMFCRYATQKGLQVKRKGGWDTHGLPVELQVEKKLGITKEDIGKTISVEEYNNECRNDVLKFKDIWDDLTIKMGYWVDLDHPYVTFENNYIESLWNLLKKLFDKGLLYKGFTIQPYSPAAGTGLSTHELNQPGAYRDVRDTTVVAQFKAIQSEHSSFLFDKSVGDVFFIAWTTTPWTLPGNSALAVGKNIVYVSVKTFNSYTFEPITVILAKERLSNYFDSDLSDLSLNDYKPGDKKIPFEIIDEFKGSQLEGIEYEQLMPYVQPLEPAFRVILATFVSTDDGTGIVHISPTFGSDDFMAAKINNIPPIMVHRGSHGEMQPIVDQKGRYVKEITDYAGEYVKEEYLDEAEKPDGYRSVDIRISIKLKESNRAFKVEKYEHSYPHCWRTDKPILYYPLDSWFIKSTAVKDRLIELNKTINWKPKSTGEGRFGDWLNNLQDWNLSRSRFWGTPLPIWTNQQKGPERKEVCKGDIASLRENAWFITENADEVVEEGLLNGLNFYYAFVSMRAVGLTSEEVWQKCIEEKYICPIEEVDESKFDLHKHFVDRIVYFEKGELLVRESDLIDVWFDSGAMPYAQLHYPFENQEEFKQSFPADFIAEGVDQTRGWFFTLHAISTMIKDSIAFKNVIANGLVLDKNGQKMSKRLGNTVDPFETLNQYGADATRWYMVANSPPWDNLRFDLKGIVETSNRFFGTLHNTYNFFALYANIDGFVFDQPRIDVAKRPEIDRWVLSLLNSLVSEVQQHMDDYDPTKAVRAIENFVVENLSNWYVRLCRRRFWKSKLNEDKIAAYQTLYECLLTTAKLMAPFAPFYTERLYQDLVASSLDSHCESIHLELFPKVKTDEIDPELELKMSLAQQISSLSHSIRKRKDISIKIRQPLARILIPIKSEAEKKNIESVRELILKEVNVKEIEYASEDSGVFQRNLKPNFPVIGQKGELRKYMKQISSALRDSDNTLVEKLEKEGKLIIPNGNEEIELLPEDVEVVTKDVSGWASATNGRITVALDINITESLHNEGIAREVINRIQNLRKEIGLEVTDKIEVQISKNDYWNTAINEFLEYICSETLTNNLILEDSVSQGVEIEINKEKGTILIRQ